MSGVVPAMPSPRGRRDIAVEPSENRPLRSKTFERPGFSLRWIQDRRSRAGCFWSKGRAVRWKPDPGRFRPCPHRPPLRPYGQRRVRRTLHERPLFAGKPLFRFCGVPAECFRRYQPSFRELRRQALAIGSTGHLYFGEDRTFLLCVEIGGAWLGPLGIPDRWRIGVNRVGAACRRPTRSRRQPDRRTLR